MLERLIARLRTTVRTIHDRLRHWTRPSTRPVLGYVLDRLRSPDALVYENTLLRKQLEVAYRQIRRPSSAAGIVPSSSS